MATFEKATVGEKISNYVENRQNVLIAILAVVVAAVIAYTVAVTVTSKANTKGIAAIDTISYVMTQESASLSEEETSDDESSSAKAVILNIPAESITATAEIAAVKFLSFIKIPSVL